MFIYDVKEIVNSFQSRLFLVRLQSNFGFWNDVVFLFDVNIMVNLCFKVLELALQSSHNIFSCFLFTSHWFLFQPFECDILS